MPSWLGGIVSSRPAEAAPVNKFNLRLPLRPEPSVFPAFRFDVGRYEPSAKDDFLTALGDESFHVFDEDASGALMGKIEDLMTKQGVKVEKTEPWGKRRLAYNIQGHRDGNYILSYLKAEPTAISEMERRLRVTDGILRFLTVRMDEQQAKHERRKVRTAEKDQARRQRKAARTASQPEVEAASPAEVKAASPAEASAGSDDTKAEVSAGSDETKKES